MLHDWSHARALPRKANKTDARVSCRAATCERLPGTRGAGYVRAMNRIDHLVWGVSDLDAGVTALERMTGLRAVYGGAHPGGGTRNALLALGPDVYLEILAPDPAQDTRNTPAAVLLALPAPSLIMFAIACDDIEATAARVEAIGLPRPKVRAMTRAQPDGVMLSWRLAMLAGHAFGAAAPFLIDWGASAHPSAIGPRGARLTALTLHHAQTAQLAALIDALGVDVACAPGAPGLTAQIETPAGAVTLRTA